MKKTLLFLIGIFFSFHAFSHDFHDGKEYYTLNKKIINVPEIIQFFSFFCPYCYEFEKKNDIQSFIHEYSKKKIKLAIYHINFVEDKLSILLTRAWIIAGTIGVEKKIMLPFFKAIQEKNSIHNQDNIKELFLKTTHITDDKYNKLWNSFSIEMILHKQEKNTKKIPIDRIPSILINGKYVINCEKINILFKKNYLYQYFHLIKFLLNK